MDKQEREYRQFYENIATKIYYKEGLEGFQGYNTAAKGCYKTSKMGQLQLLTDFMGMKFVTEAGAVENLLSPNVKAMILKQIDIINEEIKNIPNLEIYGKDDSEKPEEPKDKLVGHLNRKMGYNGFITNEIGTEVYETEDRYYFYIVHATTLKSEKKTFYKHNSASIINFI